MMFYADPSFFVIAGALSLVAVGFGFAERRSSVYTLLSSVIMLALAFGGDVQGAVSLGGFVLLGYLSTLATLSLFRKKYRAAVAVYRALLVAVISPLVAVKATSLFAGNILGFIGVSYLTFKAVQVLIEIRDGLIESMTLWDYLSFLLFFPVFTSGPITRSRDYLPQLHRSLSRDEFGALLAGGLLRFVKGFVYTFVLAALFEWLMWFVPSALEVYEGFGITLLSQCAYGLFYGLYLFFDFAGYSLMAIGIGSCFGIEVPMNFNAPFKSVDIKDFWNRWHMTLSFWLRDFVFMRMVRSMRKRKLFASRTTTACVAFVVEMTLMGLWHGFTIDYILYGAYHGMLLAACELFQTTQFYKNHKKQRGFQIASWALTMVAVFFGFALFSGQVTSIVLGA